MKATLEFDLPEEESLHLAAINGDKWHCVVSAIDQHLRSIVKYGDDPQTANHADKIRSKLHDLIDVYGLTGQL